MKRFFAIVIACLAITSASAQDKVVIDYSDLDLSTPAGASVLYGRIARAAQAVCHEVPLLEVHRYLTWKGCTQSAIADAVATVDSPLVTARHQREYPRRLYSSRATTQ
jgi:UrcA family protein